MARDKHEFQFKASDIAKAAAAEAEYHDRRTLFWQQTMDHAYSVVEKTAKVSIKKMGITNGWRPDVVVDYGDQSAYLRMQESAQKIQRHQQLSERFKSEATLYGTQADRVYDLGVDDVHHFRMGGGPREE